MSFFAESTCYNSNMIANLITLELRLLVLKHGMADVLRELAVLRDVSPEELERELVAAEQRKSSRKSTKPLDLPERLNQLQLSPEQKERVSLLARRYEAGLFLSRAKDVSEFLRKFTGNERPIKNRREACREVIEVLASRDEVELERLIESSANETNGDDLAMVAAGIMGSHHGR